MNSLSSESVRMMESASEADWKSCVTTVQSVVLKPVGFYSGATSRPQPTVVLRYRFGELVDCLVKLTGMISDGVL